MKMNLNKNVLAVKEQIENSLEILLNLKLIQFYNPLNIKYTDVDDVSIITWFNHSGGRKVSGDAFLTLDQYLTILDESSYHALLHDFSIIRISFKFKHNKLVSQNLLWWPCPVYIKQDDDGILSPLEIVNPLLGDSKNYRMRSPIRIDFDISNDTAEHPKAHIHTQHAKSRMNTVNPICFNTFIKFIFNHYYPHIKLKNKDFPSLKINYPSSSHIEYNLNEKLILS